jgi:mycoredoxin
MVLCGLFVGGAQAIAGHRVAGAAIAVFLLLVALAVSPRAFPRSVTDAAARAAAEADGRPILYWRPGCPYCLRLRLRLGRDARRLHWVDIWADPDGAASVRDVTGGDETVPTVVAGPRSFVNPDVDLVRGLWGAGQPR